MAPSPDKARRALRLSPPFVVLFVFFLMLGRWQLHRMHEKEALFAEFESGGLITLPLSQVDPAKVARYQHVIASGHFDGAHQVLLDNMTHQGGVGYRVLTPLVVSEDSVVLVDRGWVPMGRSRTELPDVSVPEGLRGLSGRLDEPPRAGIELAGNERTGGWPRVLSYPTMAELEQAFGRRLLPRIILLDADQPDGYVREWRPATFPPERHLGYAATWFSLAATVVIAYLSVVLRKRN